MPQYDSTLFGDDKQNRNQGIPRVFHKKTQIIWDVVLCRWASSLRRYEEPWFLLSWKSGNPRRWRKRHYLFKFGKHSPKDRASDLRKSQTSYIPLSEYEPKVLQFLCFTYKYLFLSLIVYVIHDISANRHLKRKLNVESCALVLVKF